MLVTVIATFARIRPSTTVMALPRMGRKAKNPIHAPLPAMKFSEFLFFNMQVLFNPICTAQSTHTIVYHAANDVACCAI